MGESNHQAPGITTLIGRLVRTAIGAFQNRCELFAVEWQEERVRIAELLVWAIGLMFLAMMGIILLTGTIIFLFPGRFRLYVAGVFTLLYLAGAVWAWFGLKSLLREEPFSESLEQVKKDRQWLDSLK